MPYITKPFSSKMKEWLSSNLLKKPQEVLVFKFFKFIWFFLIRLCTPITTKTNIADCLQEEFVRVAVATDDEVSIDKLL